MMVKTGSFMVIVVEKKKLFKTFSKDTAIYIKFILKLIVCAWPP